MDIAVIGGGHGSHAAAADLSLQGHQVRFWRRDHQAFAPILKQQTIELTDASGQRSVPLALATTELKAAVRGAKLVLVPLPATAHAGLVEALIDCLEDEQVVLMPPGTFGSYFFARALEAARPGARVMFAESGTLPYLTRLQTPTRVAIRVRATRLPTGVFPAEKREQAYQVIREAYPAVEPLADALDGALMNAGPIIHPPLIVLNAGAIEYFRGLNPGWDIHKEGTQPAVRRVTDQLDAERIAIRKALGYAAPHFPLADHYDDARDEWMYGNSSHERLVESGDWREELDLESHRYMLEDVAIGLSFLTSVGRYASVPTPVADALLSLGRTICKTNFLTTRGLEQFDLHTLERAVLRRHLHEGFK